jgi:membrane protein
MTLDKFTTLIKRSYQEFRESRASQLAAAIAFFAVFALAPLMVLTVIAAGILLGNQAAEGKLVDPIAQTAGGDIAKVLESAISESKDQLSNPLTTIIFLIFTAVFATMMMRQVQSSLNIIWGLESGDHQDDDTSESIRKNLISFISAVALVVLVVALAIASAFVNSLDVTMPDLSGSLVIGSRIVSAIAAVLILTGVFALMYRYLPEAEVAWRDVLWGAGITAVMVVIGNVVMALYLANTSYESMYGTAGTFVAVLTWIYYTALIFLFGAEITQTYANLYGSKLKDTDAHDGVTVEKQQMSQERQKVTH